MQPTFLSINRLNRESTRLTCRETGACYAFRRAITSPGFVVMRDGELMARRSTVNGCILAIESDARWQLREQKREQMAQAHMASVIARQSRFQPTR